MKYNINFPDEKDNRDRDDMIKLNYHNMIFLDDYLLTLLPNHFQILTRNRQIEEDNPLPSSTIYGFYTLPPTPNKKKRSLHLPGSLCDLTECKRFLNLFLTSDWIRFEKSCDAVLHFVESINKSNFHRSVCISDAFHYLWIELKDGTEMSCNMNYCKIIHFQNIFKSD